jgi:hypothetical protein
MAITQGSGEFQQPITTAVWVAMTKMLVEWYQKEYPSAQADALDPEVAAVALSAAESEMEKAKRNLVARMPDTPLTPDEEMLQLRGVKKDQLNMPEDFPVGDPADERANWRKARDLAINVADDLDTTFKKSLWKALLGSRSQPGEDDTGGRKPNRGKPVTSCGSMFY